MSASIPIIDDEIKMGKALCHALVQAGYDVDAVDDPRIEQLRREQKLLRQRLEANEKTLEELSKEIEKAMTARQKRGGRSGQSGPGDGETTELPPRPAGSP
jgi:predicted RNase H-like nuclease (RuvC/YqgF family)